MSTDLISLHIFQYISTVENILIDQSYLDIMQLFVLKQTLGVIQSALSEFNYSHCQLFGSH